MSGVEGNWATGKLDSLGIHDNDYTIRSKTCLLRFMSVCRPNLYFEYCLWAWYLACRNQSDVKESAAKIANYTGPILSSLINRVHMWHSLDTCFLFLGVIDPPQSPASPSWEYCTIVGLCRASGAFFALFDNLSTAAAKNRFFAATRSSAKT